MNGMLYNGISCVIGFLQLWVLKRKILAKNQHAQRKLHIVFHYFVNTMNHKWQNLTFKVNFQE